MKSLHALRISAIAAAFALAVPAVHAANSVTLPTPKVSSVTNANETYDSFIVAYTDGATERSSNDAVMQNVKVAISRAGLDRAVTSSNGAAIAPLTASHERKLAIGADVIRTSRRLSQSEANNLMLQIATDPAVRYVQPNFVMRIVKDLRAPTSLNAETNAALQTGVKLQTSALPKTFAPDDPLYTNQWHFSNPIGGANVNNAWDLASGSSITVAVIDTGITVHPDLDTALADEGYDFITKSFYSGRATDGRVSGGWDTGDWNAAGQCPGGGPASASSWHGTHVSGTVAALTNNSEGVAGVAYNARVLPIRVLGHCGGEVADIADAIVWASGGHVNDTPDNTHPAQVINMSLGASVQCGAVPAVADAVASAISRGTTVVAAAGNEGEDASNDTPASCPGVIAVAANGITGKRAFYSNYGTTVAISAPGGGVYVNDDQASGAVDNINGFVWSTSNLGDTTPEQPDYAGGPKYAGTSMASPHVAGTVALVLGATKAAGLADPTPAEIKTIITKSARAFPVAPDQRIGAGILDAAAAVTLAVEGDTGNPGDGDNDPGTTLPKGVILSGETVGAGTAVRYSIEVPAGATTLNIRTIGGRGGDVSLYVKAGSAPAADGSDADFSSIKPGNNEAVVLQSPEATMYYILVVGGDNITHNLSVLADYKP